MESYLLAPSDVAGVVTVFEKNACDGGGYRRFASIKRREGSGVAVAGWYAALQENLPRGLVSQQGQPFSHRGRAVTEKDRDVVRGNK